MTSARRVGRGDVVIFDTPFSNQRGSKSRPTVIVSTEAFHRGRNDVLIAGLTSNIAHRLAGKHILSEWVAAGLDWPSATSGQIYTAERSIIGRRVGSVSDGDMAGITEALKQIFGMAG